MPARAVFLIFGIAALPLLGCAPPPEPTARNLVADPFPEAQAELREVMKAMTHDMETANAQGLRDVHLNSPKFTKFSGRTYERSNVEATVTSETTAITSVEDYKSDARDLKIDVFGDVAVVTYYPHRTVKKDGEVLRYSARQTLVFVKTSDGWKIAHEHQSRREPLE